MAKPTKKASGGPERREFGAEVTRLLEILVHSVYADREVFLRELVSNAADALDKLRYLAVSDGGVLGDDPELRIEIVGDAEAGTLDVIDNGIGMSRDELIDNLGTIAKSGTRAFMEEAGEAGATSAQIGQFGIGFYSAFIVASHVEVTSRRTGTEESWVWSSDGTGAFTIEPAPAGDGAIARGTRVRLKLREGMDEFARPQRVQHIVKTHSDHVAFPIHVVGVSGGARGEPVRANSAGALWSRPKSEITEEQYKEFFGSLGGIFDEPALTIHYKAEGRHEYDVLLFVPASRPLDLFDPARASRVKLYVRRVLITDEAGILPPYLRFVRGVVDSADMPLTVSRDMLQDNPVAGAIKKAVTNRVLSTLAREADANPEAFARLWDAFGPVIKEGLYEDYERRDELLELLRFGSTAGDGLRSLKQYVADIKQNQTAIYFLTGEDASSLRASPQLEGFRARGLEVLLLTDPVDSFWTQAVMGYEGKPFKSVARGADDLAGIARVDRSDDAGAGPEEGAPRPADVASAVAFIRQTLGEAVSDVRISERLVESAACLVAADGGLDRTLERLLGERRAGERTKPVLEINPRHRLIAALAKAVVNGGSGGKAEDAARMLFDCALITDGERPRDMTAFAARMQQMMEKALG